MPHHTARENTQPSDKVKAATAAGSGMGAVGAALATVILWGFQHYSNVAVSEPVAAALPVVLTAVLAGLGALVAGYNTRENHPAPSAVATVHERGLK